MEREPRPVEALRRAAARTRRVLVDGYRPKKLAVLAFATWLASLGGQLRVRVPALGTAPRLLPDVQARTVEEIGPWMIVALAAVALISVFAVALRVVTLFVESRGAFVLVDAVVRDRAVLARPWSRYGALADDLFVIRLELAAVQLAALVPPAAVAVGALSVWAWLSPGEGADLLPVAVAVAAVCCVYIVAVVALRAAAGAVLDDLVVPVMYGRRCGVVEAVEVVVDAARRAPGAARRYVAVRAGLGLGVGAVSLLVTLVFCCVSWIPFVSAVLLLPVTVFVRAFGLQVAAGLAPDLERLAPR